MRGHSRPRFATAPDNLTEKSEFQASAPAMKTLISTAIFLLLFASSLSATAQETAGVLPVKATVNDSTGAHSPELTEMYRVGVGDVLDIRLLNSANSKSTLFTVIGGGVIDLPVAGGTISVAGLTPDEIQTRIAAELKRR